MSLTFVFSFALSFGYFLSISSMISGRPGMITSARVIPTIACPMHIRRIESPGKPNIDEGPQNNCAIKLVKSPIMIVAFFGKLDDICAVITDPKM